jgi:hypothetical protein
VDASATGGAASSSQQRGRGRGRGTGARGRRGASFASRSAARPATKGKNFQAEEEVQLTKSVLAISQDPIIGNQQKNSAFWNRIFEHFRKHKPRTDRTARSLDSKWGQIKHDVGEFIGCHKQVTKNKPTGTSTEDIIRLAKEMYQVKSAKGSEFTFFHCWVLVKDFPRWADGWGTMKQCTPSKRRASTSIHDSHEGVSEETSVVEGNGSMDKNAILREWPGGTKAAKAVQKADKERDGATYRQAEATAVLAEATVAKNMLLAEQNLLMLMTTPDSQISGPAALRFIRMRQEEELLKYETAREENRRRLEEEAAALDAARLVAAREEQERRDETTRQVNERAAEMQAQHGEANFGED